MEYDDFRRMPLTIAQGSAAQATNDSITRNDGGNWVLDGYAANMLITINGVQRTIESTSALTLTLTNRLSRPLRPRARKPLPESLLISTWS